MSCLGTFFALPTPLYKSLAKVVHYGQLMEIHEAQLEPMYDSDWSCSMDCAWDALHRCCSDGSLESDGSDRALPFMGGTLLGDGEEDIYNLLSADQVQRAAAALEPLDEAWLRSRFAEVVAEGDYEGPGDEDDLEHTLTYFGDLGPFFKKAAAAGLPVLFYATQ